MKTKKQIELAPTATARVAVSLLAVATAVIPVLAFADESGTAAAEGPNVRSRHPNALPLIITHGWPGSILEGQGHWPAHRSHDLWRRRRGRLGCRYTLDARLWLLGQTAEHWLGSRTHRARVGRANGASGIQALFVSRGRLGFGSCRCDGPPDAAGALRHPRQYACGRASGCSEAAEERRPRADRAVR
jgi:hypothetical protein